MMVGFLCSFVVSILVYLPLFVHSHPHLYSSPPISPFSHSIQVLRNFSRSHPRPHLLHHLRHPHPHASSSSSITGDMYFGFMLTVSLSPSHISPFNLILDTGSSDFAVASSPSCGCSTYYPFACEGREVSVHYGNTTDENGREILDYWQGKMCEDQVYVKTEAVRGGRGESGKGRGEEWLDVGQMQFAGIQYQVNSLECEDYEQNGIIGIAYPSLLSFYGPLSSSSSPSVSSSSAPSTFLTSLSTSLSIPRIVAFHICSPSFLSPLSSFSSTGSIDFGGVHPSHYSHSLYWTEVIEKRFYAVDLVGVRVGEVEVMPKYDRKSWSWNDTGREEERQRWKEEQEQKLGEYSKRLRQIHSHPHSSSLSLSSSSSSSSSSSFPLLDLSITDNQGIAPQSIVDSGSTGITFPPLLYSNFIYALSILQPEQEREVWEGDGTQCVIVREGEKGVEEWPTMKLVVKGGREGRQGEEEKSEMVDAFELSIPPCRYLVPALPFECSNRLPPSSSSSSSSSHSHPRYYHLLVQSSNTLGIILGTTVYESYYVVHDQENDRVGFGKVGGCQNRGEEEEEDREEEGRKRRGRCGWEEIKEVKVERRRGERQTLSSDVMTANELSDEGLNIVGWKETWSWIGLMKLFLVSVLIGLVVLNSLLHGRRAGYELLETKVDSEH